MKIQYQPGDILEEGQYLLKTRPSYYNKNEEVGFLTKFNKDGTIPKSFIRWGTHHTINGIYNQGENMPIFIVDEYFRPGWKIIEWRNGASQCWAKVLHPDGYILEIYLNNLFEIIADTTVVKNVLQGEYKWESNKLVKKT